MTATNVINDKPSQNTTISMNSVDTFECETKVKIKWMIWTIASIVLISVLMGALFGAHLAITLMNHNNNKTSASDNVPGSLKFVSRSEWVAQPPEKELDPLELPATRVIIAHTATENCTTQTSCTYAVRLIQTFHMESRGFDDIGFNFLIGGDGAVYVGRDWDIQGAHTKGYNVKSICIAFIGTFNNITPNKRQLAAAQSLIDIGVKRGKLSTNYSLYGQRQMIPSESPGSALYDIIKKWDHWSEEIK